MAARRLLSALADGHTDADVGLGIDVPAHRSRAATVDAADAVDLYGAFATDAVGGWIERRALVGVPGAPAVGGVGHALLRFGAVLGPDIAEAGLPPRVALEECAVRVGPAPVRPVSPVRPGAPGHAGLRPGDPRRTVRGAALAVAGARGARVRAHRCALVITAAAARTRRQREGQRGSEEA